MEVPASTQIPARGTADVGLAYRPLVVGQQTATTVFTCPELGDYAYTLLLVGLSTGPEQQASFSVALGGSEARVCRVTHWLPANIDYTCSLKSSGTQSSKLGFSCPPKMAAKSAGPEGSPIETEVIFEPMLVGDEFRDALVLQHAEAGTYEVPLIGHCSPPKP